MVKGKLQLMEKAKRILTVRLGSLVAGFEDKEEENGGSNLLLESGEELETILPNGLRDPKWSDKNYGTPATFSISSDKFRVLQEPDVDRKMFESLSLNRFCIALAESYGEEESNF
ncbi:hypothetical protein ACFX13_012622 [Malus domestica]